MATTGFVCGLFEFNPKKSTWEEWCEILTHVFVANGITDEDNKKSILLASCGTETYQLIRALVLPVKPSEKTFDQLVVLLKEHFTPKPSEIVQRFKFHSRNRKAGESVAAYVAELRKLTDGCDFGTSLQAMLRDRLVCGICDDNIQKKLLSETALAFSSALKIANAIEAADKNLQDLHGDKTVGHSVHKFRSKPSAQSTKDQRPHVGSGNNKTCFRCGKTTHAPHMCFYKNEKCHKCGKRGHIVRVCRSKESIPQKQNSKAKFRGRQKVNAVVSEVNSCGPGNSSASVEDLFENSLFHVSTQTSAKGDPNYPNPYYITVDVNGTPVTFEVDTGCPVTIVNEQTAQRIGLQSSTLYTSQVPLRSYTGQEVDLNGYTTVEVSYEERSYSLPISIAKGNGSNLLGRTWVQPLNFDLRDVSVNLMKSTDLTLNDVLERHSAVFEEGLGTLKGFQAHIYVDKDATPKFFKPRSVPYALRQKIEVELDRLLSEGIIEPIKHSEWACPIVPVIKPDSSVRICGDFKLTVNQFSKLEQYPIPTLEDLCTKLSGGVKFTKLDMSHAYQQLVLDEESRKYVVINTHKGLFRYTRLPFGVSSAPAIFQRMIESILQGLDYSAGYLDDIINSGINDSEHLRILDEVLHRLSEAGLRLRRNKCVFMADEVEYLGYRLDSEGLHPVEKKIAAIQEAKVPENVKELRAYLGILNYYHRFLPNLPDTLSPLYKLLQKEVKWSWSTSQQKAFEKSKNLLQSSDVLIHFDSSKPLLLQCDASPYGVGVVLAHQLPDGSERPISFASRTLTKAEQNYSQLDREGLSVIFGLRKFHKYVYGRHFQIVTDHKPLVSLFNENNPVPQMVSPRVQRWSVLLTAYDYKIVHRKGTQHTNADALSRLPAPDSGKPMEDMTVLMLQELDTCPLKSKDISIQTGKDRTLSIVREFVIRGWPQRDKLDDHYEPYYRVRSELSVMDGCLLRGSRVIIPLKLRSVILSELHQSHPGITRMKGLARSYVWWPHLDADIETTVNSCDSCQEDRNCPSVAPLHPWEYPSQPWQRLHMDYAGPFTGSMFLIVIDAYSKWIECAPMSSSNAKATVNQLRRMFAAYGIPEIIVTDNATAFVGEEFATFMSRNGVEHVTTSPHHPAGNGLAERAVQIIKDGLKKTTGDTVATQLHRLLFSYRITPQSTTGVSPSMLFLGRRLRSRLDLMFPNLASKVKKNQRKLVDQSALTKCRAFQVNDSVWVKNFASGPKWISGQVDSVTGPLSYIIKLTDGRLVRRHVDHVRRRMSLSSPRRDVIERSDTPLESQSSRRKEYESDLPDTSQVDSHEESIQGDVSSVPDMSEPGEETPVVTSPVAPILRRSTRVKQQPSYLRDFVSK
ncbi:uncharacterized protein K02A2.6-like [Haliotis rufescens]|uniref:uncharacterized protein K02A2.6-like n=1 Tax=Haliotis rufescens TaxID=6454 RepID=UPI00201F732D|nr:uncharacterized protein K02A2.6-like [Haliotis rufescens]